MEKKKLYGSQQLLGCWMVVLFSRCSYQGDELTCYSTFTPALLWRPGDAQSRPPTASWGGGRTGKTILKTLHSRGRLTFSNRALLPELGLLFGDHADLQLSGPEVHTQDRRQARDRQLEENKSLAEIIKKMFRTENKTLIPITHHMSEDMTFNPRDRIAYTAVYCRWNNYDVFKLGNKGNNEERSTSSAGDPEIISRMNSLDPPSGWHNLILFWEVRRS